MKITVDLVDYAFAMRRAEMSLALANAVEALHECFKSNASQRAPGEEARLPVTSAIFAVHNALCVVHREMDAWQRDSAIVGERVLRLPFDPRYDDAYGEETSVVLKFAEAPATDDVEFWGVRDALLRDLVALSEVVDSKDERLRCRGVAVSVIDEYFEQLAAPFLNVHGVYRILLRCFAVRRDQKATDTTEP